TTHAVDHQQQLVAAGHLQVVGYRGEQVTGDLLGAGGGDAFPAGLTVDADADLDLVLAQVEGRLARVRHSAGGQGHAHRAHAGVHPGGDLVHGLQVVAALKIGRASCRERV